MPQDLFAARGLQVADVVAFSQPEESRVVPSHGSFIVYSAGPEGVLISHLTGQMNDVRETYAELFKALGPNTATLWQNRFVLGHPATLQVAQPQHEHPCGFVLRLTLPTGGSRALPLRFPTEHDARSARDQLLAAGLKEAT